MKRKPLFIAYLILVTLAFGVQTYSWFSSKAESVNNSFSAGTLRVKLNESENIVLFNAPELIPGDPNKALITNITIVNGGSLGCEFYDTEVMVEYIKDGAKWNGDSGEAGTNRFKSFRIELVKEYHVQDSATIVETVESLSFEDLKIDLESFFDGKILKSGLNNQTPDYIKLSGQVYLDEFANSDYQGVSAKVTLKLKAKQINL